ncbi:glycosyltransferase [Mucilaginibacter ginkgonis]|uniref:Glycosyltransferase n=1 Tax=Mucilaginibacter ginkgonis TaxID=2682091 RepID=A0A6I4I271_9SPHI|nr:glycosyltransferase [Mucilaginibacter ginkgonis]QQL50883.1 glycosyltransferase [Mucilaginibacter ginkgonis]
MKDLIKNRDIIMVGQQPWDTEIGSNAKNIAVEFSKNNRVLYVNSPLDRIQYLRRKDEPAVKKRIEMLRTKAENVIKISDNLWNLYPDEIIESITWIKNPAIHTFFNKINNKRLAKSIKAAADMLGFKDYILFNDNDIFRCFYLKELLHPVSSVYYIRDFMLAVDYWKHHGERLEPKLIAKSDVCVANSTYLADYCKKYNPKSYYVGQGCELDIFTDYDKSIIPKDMQPIAKPIIGYVGALQSIRLDLDLLEMVARQKPDWQIVLVGPEDGEFKKSGLHQLSNVHFPGAKSPEQLPGYINAFDVCINPQVVNPVTIGNYPRKIDEYLAMGKPTVATHTDAMEVFADQVYLAKRKEDYLTLIARALEENSPQREQARRDFAAGHTWANSVKEIYSAIIANTPAL